MKVLHLSTLNSSVNNAGVVRQLQYEKDAAIDLGIDWSVELWAGDVLDGFDFIRPYPSYLNSRLARRCFFFKVLRNYSSIYDVIVLRYMPVDPFLVFYKQDRAALISVHHTKEEGAIRASYLGLKGRILSVCDNFAFFVGARRFSAVVGVTPEIVEYELRRARRDLPTFVLPNGIDFSRFQVVDDRRLGSIKLVFVATFFFKWHGLRSLLSSIASCSKVDDFELHLVGEVSVEDVCYIHECGIKNIKLHGVVDISTLRDILALADVGLSSFGLGEKGVQQACTLKVREYLASGVPVFAGYDDIGLPDNFPFYMQGEPELLDIISYAKNMRNFGREKIRQSSMEYIDKKNLVSKFHSWVIEEIKPE